MSECAGPVKNKENRSPILNGKRRCRGTERPSTPDASETVSIPSSPRTPQQVRSTSPEDSPRTPTTPPRSTLTQLPFAQFPQTPIRKDVWDDIPVIEFFKGYDIERKVGKGSLVEVFKIKSEDIVLKKPLSEFVLSKLKVEKFRAWINIAFQEQQFLQKSGIPYLPFLNAKEDANAHLRLIQQKVEKIDFLSEAVPNAQARASIVMPLFLKMLDAWCQYGYHPLDLEPGNLIVRGRELVLTDTLSGGQLDVDQFTIYFNTWQSQGKYDFSVEQMGELRQKAQDVSQTTRYQRTKDACIDLVKSLDERIYYSDHEVVRIKVGLG